MKSLQCKVDFFFQAAARAETICVFHLRPGANYCVKYFQLCLGLSCLLLVSWAINRNRSRGWCLGARCELHLLRSLGWWCRYCGLSAVLIRLIYMNDLWYLLFCTYGETGCWRPIHQALGCWNGLKVMNCFVLKRLQWFRKFDPLEHMISAVVSSSSHLRGHPGELLAGLGTSNCSRDPAGASSQIRSSRLLFDYPLGFDTQSHLRHDIISNSILIA